VPKSRSPPATEGSRDGGGESSSSPWLPASLQSSLHPSGFIFGPFHLAEGTSLDVSGCISRGRRRGGLAGERGRWETGALCLPAPETTPDTASSRSASRPSISHPARLARDVLLGFGWFSQSDTQQGLPRPAPPAAARAYPSGGIAAGSGLLPRADEAGGRLCGPGLGSRVCLQSS